MIKAAIVWASVPSEANPGEEITVPISLENTGDEKGWLICSIAYFAEGAWQSTLGDWVELAPAVRHLWYLGFTMPNYDIEVWIDASHWEPAAYIAVSDEQKGPYPLAVEAPVVQVGPVPRIMWFLLPQEAQAGSEVTYQAAILNVGDFWGWFRLRATRLKWPYTEVSWTGFADLEVGFFKEFTGTFPMPDFNILVELQAEWWDVPDQRWRDGGDPVGYSIAVVRDEWPGVGMPQELWDALSSKWCNVYEGQWVSVTLLGFTFNIPLWSFTPGEWARDAIQWVIGVINTILGSLGEIWVTVQEAWDTAWAAAEAVDGWLSSATAFISTFIGTWWTETFEDVLHAIGEAVGSLNDVLGGRITVLEGWAASMTDIDLSWDNIAANIIDIIEKVPPFDFVLDVVRTITRLGIEMLDELPDFFSDPPGWILEKIDDWLNEPVE